MGNVRNIVRSALWTSLLAIVLLLSAQVYAAFQLPTQVRLLPGQEFDFGVGRLLTLIDESASGWLLEQNSGGTAIRGDDLGATKLQVRLLGVLPLRDVEVSVVPELSVVPGGQAIGVLISSHGLAVAETVPVVDESGMSRFPAREAGVRAGDLIVSMAGEDVYSVDQVQRIVDDYGRRGGTVDITVVRHGTRIQRTIVPVPVRDDGGPASGRFRLGLRLESPAAGVGTLTFYDVPGLRFGGLGHMITDTNNNEVAVNDGRIVEATIRGIQRGARGFPGEKIGVFNDDSRIIGAIEKNTRFGIYGVLDEPPNYGLERQPLPVALAHEVRPGPGELLTVVDGQRVESFSLRILQVHPQRRADGRGLVIQITDERLLDLTRGIVQGMSGSPIIQDGKLVGAITHVFVNDPTRGYGILAEWMAYEAEIIP